MTSLTAIFGSSANKADAGEAESEKLLHLYWNRAELKKEFSRMRSEQFKLKDCIKEHEGATARLQQKLEFLENLLLDPDWVHSIVTHFQLRGLNLRCEAKLAKFAEQLKQQREQKQHRQLLRAWDEQRTAEAEAIEREISGSRLKVQLLEDRLQVERHRLATMNGLLKLFRRRSLTALLDKIAADIGASAREERSLLQRYDEVQNRQPPDTQGLDIAAKRLINCMIIAYAQQLYLHFYRDEVAAMAKEAGAKSVGAINYGGKESSDAILLLIKKRLASFENGGDIADILQRRARLIAEQARFSSDEDTVPVTDSVATVFDIRQDGTVTTSNGDLLGEDYWSLSKVLSR
ncbi:MAG: hypothetical protein OEO82_03170 [Gammaproteobacteria bacterium]|nr:hypothetical protein [Gammaproteobacteria bacterium]